MLDELADDEEKVEPVLSPEDAKRRLIQNNPNLIESSALYDFVPSHGMQKIEDFVEDEDYFNENQQE